MAGKLLDSLYVSGAGVAAASGTVSLYQPGTLVAVTAYSDDALTQPVTQPVSLDANGKTLLPLYVSAPVRAIIRAQSGATLYDITRLDGQRAEIVSLVNSSFPASPTVDAALTAVGGSFGGTNGLFLATGAGAVQRSFQSAMSDVFFNVKNYGAVGNGIADDTSAVQNAITAAAAVGGGTVFLPPGTYLINAALTIASSPASVSVVGSSRGVSIVKTSSTTANAFTVTSVGVVSFRQFTIAAATSSSGSGISVATGGNLVVDTVAISGFANGIATTASALYAQNALVNGSTAGLAQTGASSTSTVIGGQYTSGSGSGITVSGLNTALQIVGATVGGSSIAIDLGSGASMYAYGVINSGGSLVVGYRANAAAGAIFHQGCNWGDGGVTDSRTGAPVNYSLSTNTAVTPLPNQTDVVRIVATAAITVTVNAPANMGFGRRWTLICSNTSGAGVTWTFAASFKLSAAVSPATGNRVSLLLEQDAVTGNVYEVGRAATAN